MNVLEIYSCSTRNASAASRGTKRYYRDSQLLPGIGRGDIRFCNYCLASPIRRERFERVFLHRLCAYWTDWPGIGRLDRSATHSPESCANCHYTG